MTNEEAIRVLKAEWVSKESGFPDKVVREALDMAIDSIERSEKFQQKAEAIISQLRADRDRLADAIEKIRSEIESSKEWLCRNENFDIDMQASFEDIERFINNFTSVHPKQREGRWIGHVTNAHSRVETAESVVYRCSPVERIECDQCGCWFLGEHLVRRSYCPNCGAKMEAVEA